MEKKKNIKHHLNNLTNDGFHMQTLNTFPPQINTQNNISCLKQFNDFLKNSTFEFGCCCVCGQRNINMNFKCVK